LRHLVVTSEALGTGSVTLSRGKRKPGRKGIVCSLDLKFSDSRC